MSVALVLLVSVVWLQHRAPEPGTVRDEALLAGRTADTFPAADEDYFHDMDAEATPDGPKPPALTLEEVKGRNTWLVWSAGNDRMWDLLSVTSFGGLDLLKTISSHETLGYGRTNRWERLGLVNEPCFEASTASDDAYRFGLRLDRRRDSSECGSDPFENAVKYPGVRTGARAAATIRWRGHDAAFGAGSFYGYATGIVGLRLFPNPAFDQAAADAWDPERYYTDPSYYNRASLVRPYRVGMSCGFCHVGPNPINPPPDPNSPQWQHLSSNVGAQYFQVEHVITWRRRPADFAYQLLHASRPGTLDTSFIAPDGITNPRSMNALYMLGARLAAARRTGRERLAGGGLDNRQFNDGVTSGPLTAFFQKPDIVWTPRVLKDGADSVGALGALNRVYLNVGAFSEEWLLHFTPMVGGKPMTPIRVAIAREHSAAFAATERQTPDVARFFLRTTAAHHLKDAPGGEAHLTESPTQVARGREVFADICARCHSSKAPSPPATVLTPVRCEGKDRNARVQGADARHRWRQGLSRRQLPVERAARAGDAPSDQRLQPACLQRHGRPDLGQFLVAVLQGSPVGGDDHVVPPGDGRGAPVRHASRRAWLHAATLAREPLVNRAVSVEQHSRPLRIEPVRRGAHAVVPGIDRGNVVAGTPREGLESRSRGRGAWTERDRSRGRSPERRRAHDADEHHGDRGFSSSSVAGAGRLRRQTLSTAVRRIGRAAGSD
jgi:hypothetical protein